MPSPSIKQRNAVGASKRPPAEGVRGIQVQEGPGHPEPGDVLLGFNGLVEKILQFTAETKQAARTRIDTSAVFPDGPASHMAKGDLIANLRKLRVDEPFIRESLLGLCALEIEGVKDKAGEIERFANAIRAGTVDLLAIQEALLGKKDHLIKLQNELNVDYQLVFSISSNTFRAVFEAALESSGIPFEDEQWHRNYCPACGAFAAMARLEKDTGKRRLWCSVCSSEWTFKRVQCPYCCNDDKASLDYFFLDDGTPYRVDVCHACKGYIKTIDENKAVAGKVVFLEEDTKTSYLDLMAEQEGFNKIIQGE